MEHAIRKVYMVQETDKTEICRSTHTNLCGNARTFYKVNTEHFSLELITNLPFVWKSNKTGIHRTYIQWEYHGTVGYPRGVMVKAKDCRIVVSEFVLQSRYYVHFRANTLGKGMNPLILLAMG